MNVRHTNERGLTLVEICVAMVVLATAAMGMAASMMTGMAANRVYQQNTLVLARAQQYLELLNNLQFGDSGDAALAVPDSADDTLADLFNVETEVGANPPSLYAIAKVMDVLPNGILDLATIPDLPTSGVPGSFLIRVTNNVTTNLSFPASVDADADGIPDNGVATLLQGSFLEQVAGEGCYETSIADDGMELFGFEIFYRPPAPAGAAPKLVLRGIRAQDP